MLVPKKNIVKLLNTVPEIQFTLLFGSAKAGIVPEGSDIDLGIGLAKNDEELDILMMISALLEDNLPEFRFDIVNLYTASPILRFEALQGEVIFLRDDKDAFFSDFYAKTCAEYEDQIFWMKKQLKYRGYEVQWSN